MVKQEVMIRATANDRVVHNAHKIFLKGDSMRKTKSSLSNDKLADDNDFKLEN